MHRKSKAAAFLLLALATSWGRPSAAGDASDTSPDVAVPRHVPPDAHDPLDLARIYLTFAEPARAAELIPEDATDQAAGRLHLSLLVRAGRYQEALAELRRRPEIGPPGGRTPFLRAYLQWKIGADEEASETLATYLPEADEDLRPVARALLWLVAPPSDESEVRDAIHLLESRLPVGLRDRLRDLLHERLAFGRGDPGLYLELVRALREVDGILRAEEYLVAEAYALLELGETEAARWLLTDLMLGVEDPDLAVRIVDLLEEHYAESLTPFEKVSKVKALQGAGRYDRAAARLAELLADERLDPGEHEEVRFLQAKNLFLRKRYRTAAREFARLEGKLTLPEWKAECALYLARSQFASRHRDEAQKAYVRLAREYPRHPIAGEALYVAARRYEVSGRLEEAMALYGEYLESFPGGEYTRDVLLALGLRKYTAGDADGAAELLQRVVQGRGSAQREAATFWLARLEGERGNEEAYRAWVRVLKERYPESFYLRFLEEWEDAARVPSAEGGGGESGPSDLGVLSTGIEQALGALHDALADGALARYGKSSPRPAERDRYRRGGFFLEWGCVDLALGDLVPLESAWGRKPDRLAELLELYVDSGLANRSLRVITRLSFLVPGDQRNEFRRSVRSLLYPTPFYPTVLEVARTEGLEPELIYAVIREESWFDQEAVSGAGAWGLMQLMPSTGRQMAASLRLPFHDEKTLTEPGLNIRLGARYLDRLSDRHQGEAIFVLTSYNGGPARASLWVRAFDRTHDLALFVDTLEFRETRAYVKKVLRSRRIYRGLLPSHRS